MAKFNSNLGIDQESFNEKLSLEGVAISVQKTSVVFL